MSPEKQGKYIFILLNSVQKMDALGPGPMRGDGGGAEKKIIILCSAGRGRVLSATTRQRICNLRP